MAAAPSRRAARWLRGLLIGVAAIAGLLGAAIAVFATPDIPAATLRAKYANAASQFVELAPGTTIHMRDEGPRTGFAVVLVHGSNASLHTWEPWAARLIRRGYRVISLDLPAHGLTGATTEGLYTNAAYVGIVEQLVNRLDVQRFVLGGNSMGGGVAWRYALRHPERLAGLVLVDASGKPRPKGASPPLGFSLARVPVLRDVMAIVTPRTLIERSFKQSIAVQSIATLTMVDRYWELLLYPGNRTATVARFGQYQAGEDAAAALASLQVPTLIIWGREDHFIPVSVGAWFSQTIPGARITILDGVGHIPMEEAPDRSLAPVLQLLMQVAPAPNPAPTAAGTVPKSA